MNYLVGAFAGSVATLAVQEKFPDAIPSLGLAKPSNIDLTYFDLAGLGDKIRMTFLLGGVPFNDKRIPFEEWPSIKPTTPFGQLPVMEIDGIKVAQSNAMLNYAGKITGLLPKDPMKAMKVDEVLGVTDDLRSKIRPSVEVGYDKNKSEREKKRLVQAMRKELIADGGAIRTYFGHYEKMLEASGDGGYMCGSQPTIADTTVLTTIRWIAGGKLDHVPTDIIDGYPRLKAYKEQMEGLPAIAEYLKDK